MEPQSRVEAFEHAAKKNAVAVDLMAKGKLRDALTALNQAIAAAPTYHHSYANRAVLFERMGLLPQAEGDRRKAAELAPRAAAYDSLHTVEAAAPSPTLPATPSVPRISEPAATPVVIPSARAVPAPSEPPVAEPRPVKRAGFPQGILLPVAFFVLLIGITAGTLIGALALVRDLTSDDAVRLPPGATQSPSEAAGQAETPAPTAVPPAAATGSPFSFSNVEAAWRAKGITANLGAANPSFSGFKVAPLDVSLTGGTSAELSVFFYPASGAPSEDWDLAAGSRPSPKPGRTLPGHVTIWFNQNVVVVVRSAASDTAPAFSAFIDQ